MQRATWPTSRRSGAWRVAGLAAALFCVAAIARADVTFAATDVPTIFFVSKSDDRNRVDYGIRLDASCRPASRSPMVVYWREFEGGHEGRYTHDLNLFEGPIYGVGALRVTETRADGATLTIEVRALPSRPITIRTGPSASGAGCTATASLAIDGRPSQLHHVHLTLGDSPGTLRYADIHGTASGGGAVTERVVR